MSKPLVGPVNFLKRLYRSVLVFASTLETACFAHSGFVLTAKKNVVSIASDISSVFLTVRVVISSLIFLPWIPRPYSLILKSSVFIDPRTPTVKLACVHFHLRLPCLRELYSSMNDL